MPKDSFVHIVDKNIDLKQVVNTNKCLIHLEKHGDKLLIISCIDNLLKGASGQAVHNMNLMFNPGRNRRTTFEAFSVLMKNEERRMEELPQ